MHEYGDAVGAKAIANCARAALASSNAFGFVTEAVRTDAAGWYSAPIADHDPLVSIIDTPVNMQLVGSDGAGTHAVATLGGFIFDAAEQRTLPLSRAALDHCVGAQLNGARFSQPCCARGAACAGQEPAQAVAEGFVWQCVRMWSVCALGWAQKARVW